MLRHRARGYDVRGDSVDVASRPDASSEPNLIHVFEAVAEMVRGTFRPGPRDTLELKGRGETNTYFILSRRA